MQKMALQSARIEVSPGFVWGAVNFHQVLPLSNFYPPAATTNLYSLGLNEIWSLYSGVLDFSLF